MNFLKKIFGAKKHIPEAATALQPILTYADFWNWFRQHARQFFTVVKGHDHIESEFLDKLAPRLRELKDGISCLTGMYDDHTAELILTADGILVNIFLIEELIAAAPAIDGWRFSALKQPTDMEKVNLEMEGYSFSAEKISFYVNNSEGYPDDIDITMVHKDYNQQHKTTVTNGTFIFLDLALGELQFAETIDNMNVAGAAPFGKDLIPVQKLKEFLDWRQLEFVEKYDGTLYNTGNDNYAAMEAKLEDGSFLIAMINTDLLRWDRKASHPWILEILIPYGNGQGGAPDEAILKELNGIQDEMIAQLPDRDGYLNIGRETTAKERVIYFACKEYRKPAKVLYETQKQYRGKFEIAYDIYKDKYWRSFQRFQVH